MKCQDIFYKLGFECRTVDTLSGRPAIRIATPVCTLDGSPMHVIIESMPGGVIRLSDDAETLFLLHGEGFTTLDRRRWSTLSATAESLGIKLVESGEFSCSYKDSDLPFVFGDWLQLYSAITEWQRERVGRPQDDVDFVDEVEFLLKQIWPKEIIERNYKTRGFSGSEYEFDFRMGSGKFIDAMSPDSRSTGSRLRKILDIQKIEPDVSIQIIMDDRDNPEKAISEIGILNSIVKVKRFTDLIAKPSAKTQAHIHH